LDTIADDKLTPIRDSLLLAMPTLVLGLTELISKGGPDALKASTMLLDLFNRTADLDLRSKQIELEKLKAQARREETRAQTLRAQADIKQEVWRKRAVQRRYDRALEKKEGQEL
jgi:hypothetical protein